MLRPVLAVLTLAFAAIGVGQASAESYTTRIEPRPYYGAVVTIEQGVRVWRPLPPVRHMIINPTNAPVNLNVTDIRETVTNHNHINGTPVAATNGYAPYYSGAPGILYARPGKRSVHHRRFAASGRYVRSGRGLGR